MTTTKNLVLAFFAIGPLSAFGALTLYEGFDYAENSGLSGQSGGSGFAGGGDAWDVGSSAGSTPGNLTVSAGSLTYGPLLTSGNAASGTRSNDNVAMYRDLAVTMGGDGSEVWMSFLIQATTSTAGLSLFGSTEATFFGAINGGYSHRLYSGAGTPMTGNQFNSTATAFDSGTHFMVAQFDMTQTVPVFNVWVDPDSSSLGNGATPTGGSFQSVASGTQDFTFDRLRIGMFSNNQTMVLDELRMGDSWVDVSPVPEPATTLLALGGVAAAFRRKRA
ncbi:PEP-CTERM sorting domain-containing protein [Roseibacillus ishigakijimensis]|uniref:PEP-CTERM sorting domain-containing protein n=1 Tax=Roseibacillus ishigakijimensis TaxID=454146 RepID=A0A934RR91_9BACT|nr:PEP-CTERM sorting domain-containing protein [Roseibacillus ishigakijimensis]MBK1834447.1 PEP-CTERM sorting domain-containing protein [Roseibacillus ishigakijimensis]